MQNGAIRYGKVFSHKPATMAWRLRLAPAWEVPRILLQPLSSNMMPRNGEQFISKWPHNSQDWSREVWNKCEYILTKLYAHTHTYTHVYIYIYIYTLILNLYLYIILISSYIISCSVRSCQHWEPGLKNGRAHEDDDALTLFGAWLLWPKVAASTREIYHHLPHQCWEINSTHPTPVLLSNCEWGLAKTVSWEISGGTSWFMKSIVLCENGKCMEMCIPTLHIFQDGFKGLRIPKSCPPRISQRWIKAAPIAAFVWQPQHAWAKQCMVKQSGRLGTASSYMGVFKQTPFQQIWRDVSNSWPSALCYMFQKHIMKVECFRQLDRPSKLCMLSLLNALHSKSLLFWFVLPMNHQIYINQPPSQSAHNPTQSHITPA